MHSMHSTCHAVLLRTACCCDYAQHKACVRAQPQHLGKITLKHQAVAACTLLITDLI